MSADYKGRSLQTLLPSASRPLVKQNCGGGWLIAMMAKRHHDVEGVVIVISACRHHDIVFRENYKR